MGRDKGEVAKKPKLKEAISYPVYDATKLGKTRMVVLGAQHLFAMFGATVLVPALTGLSVSATLFFAGIGTLIFHLISKRKVPAFLGSSFAFLAGYMAIAPGRERELLPYACFGVACAGIIYLILAVLFMIFEHEGVMSFLPPVVTGPIIIAIGLSLSQSAVDYCSENWAIAIIAILIIIMCSLYGRGMLKIVPIIMGVVGSLFIASVMAILVGGNNDNFVLFNPEKIQAIKDAAWIGLPIDFQDTVFSIFKDPDYKLLVSSVLTITPIALATIVEHIGDISAISSTVGEDFINDPGLHRTLTGDGIATTVASLFGAPANTTYGENTGVLSLSRVYDPKVIEIAAVFSIVLSFSPKVAACIFAIPTSIIGGISLVLYGMISAVGIRNIVENKVDFSKSRNVIIAAIILVLAVGIKYSAEGAINIYLGTMTVSLSGLAVGSIVGIILNAILPGRDYKLGEHVEDVNKKPNKKAWD